MLTILALLEFFAAMGVVYEIIQRQREMRSMKQSDDFKERQKRRKGL